MACCAITLTKVRNAEEGSVALSWGSGADKGRDCPLVSSCMEGSLVPHELDFTRLKFMRRVAFSHVVHAAPFVFPTPCCPRPAGLLTTAGPLAHWRFSYHHNSHATLGTSVPLRLLAFGLL